MSVSLWRRLWREPLTRFFAVGAGLFLVYAVVGTHSPADDRRIHIDQYELQVLAAPQMEEILTTTPLMGTDADSGEAWNLTPPLNRRTRAPREI